MLQSCLCVGLEEVMRSTPVFKLFFTQGSVSQCTMGVPILPNTEHSLGFQLLTGYSILTHGLGCSTFPGPDPGLLGWCAPTIEEVLSFPPQRIIIPSPKSQIQSRSPGRLSIWVYSLWFYTLKLPIFKCKYIFFNFSLFQIHMFWMMGLKEENAELAQFCLLTESLKIFCNEHMVFL